MTRRHPTASDVEYRDLRILRLEADRRQLLEWKRRSVSGGVCSVMVLGALLTGLVVGTLL